MHKNCGFTLIEIVVASVIFALVIVGLLSVLITGNKLIIHARERITSAQLGKLFVDPLQINVSQDTWDSNALNLSDVPVVLPSETVNNRVFSASYTVKDSSTDPVLVGTNLRKVIMKITWNEPSS